MKQDGGQIRRAGEGGSSGAQLSAVGGQEPPSLPAATPGAVAKPDRPPNLVDVAIPSRDRQTRRMAVQMFRENPHLPAASRHAVVRLVHIHRLIERLVRHLQENDLFRADGEVRKALGELVRLMAEARALEGALGLTPVSMASLGVNIGRMRELAKGDGLPEADVEALEKKLLARLSEGRQTHQDGQHGAGGGEGE